MPKNGYKVYLYFIATKATLVNLERVQGRTGKGGHSVPMEKIHERYSRSLSNAYNAMQFSDKAFFFDNTITDIKSGYSFFAEKKDDVLYVKNSGNVPSWFSEHVLRLS